MNTAPGKLENRIWLPLVLFKLQWLLLVPGGSAFLWWALLLLAMQALLLLRRSGASALAGALGFALIGMLMDQSLSLLGVLQFQTRWLPPSLVLLWLSFAITLPLLPILEQLSKLKLAVVSATLGVAGYGAAFLLGALGFGVAPLAGLLLLAVCWALLLPLRQWLRRDYLRVLPPALLLMVALLPVRTGADEGWAVIGQATFRVLWSNIYEATLRSPVRNFSFPGKPFQLTLRYQRAINAERIVTATLDQWRHQRLVWPDEWRDRLLESIPTVAADDSLELNVNAAGTATLLHNDALIATFDDPEFVTALAGIWLGEGTSHPQFRRQLLGGNP